MMKKYFVIRGWEIAAEACVKSGVTEVTTVTEKNTMRVLRTRRETNQVADGEKGRRRDRK